MTTETDDRAHPGTDGSSILIDPPGAPWHRSPRVAVALLALAALLGAGIGFLGPSVLTLTLGPREGSLLPPYYLPGSGHRINSWLVAMAGYVTVVVGAAGTWVALRALGGGWRPSNRKLFGFGLGATILQALVPPMTSADVLMYAAYGRLASLGYDNYTVSPASVLRTQWDPVLRWMEDPWQGTVNVYGAALNVVMWFASTLGGDNMHDVVFWFQVIFTAAFIGAGAATAYLARHDHGLQSRAILLTIACPPMIWSCVGSAHNEAFGLALGIAGFLFLRSNPFLAGLLIGTGMTAKATVVVYALAMAWAYRRDIKKLLLCGIGGAIPNVLGYVVLFPDALKAASQNTSYVASSSWAFPVRRFFAMFMDGDQLQTLLGAATWALTIVLGWMLARVLPWRAVPGLPPGADPRRDPLTVAVRASALMSAAYLTTSAYTLPWYDLMCFMPMALLGATRLDLIELFRVTALNLGYVLGRVIPYSARMDYVSMKAREIGSSTVSVGIIVAIVLWWHEHELRTRRERGTPSRRVLDRVRGRRPGGRTGSTRVDLTEAGEPAGGSPAT